MRAIFAITALLVALVVAGAIHADAARGISPSQSLADWGF